MNQLSPTLRFLVLGVVALAATFAPACATTKAQVSLEPPPPLSVPAAPPRIIVPPDPTQAEPVEDPAPAAIPVRPRAPRANAPRPAEPAHTETAAKPPEASVEPPKPNGPETPPASTLELRPSDGAGEANIRQQLKSATAELAKVQYPSLSNDMKAQFDTARRFITLAEQALTEQNLLFAATLADKAGAIAVLLQRR
jgi:hypothetical protein